MAPASLSDSTPIDSIRYFGDYMILGEIARGGMGVVYLAKQTNLNREVALKLIRAGVLASRREVEMFHFEAEAAGSLSHPNIVRIFESGEHEGQPFVAMEWIEGTSLSEQLAEGVWKLKPSSRVHDLRSIAELMCKIASAVHHAHQHGIIHRDLKPGNVLLSSKGDPFLTDFGIAKRIDQGPGLTQTGQILGTPSYMSPEQAAGKVKDLTVSTDVYGLGAILYSMLTGEPPFRGSTNMETLDQVRHSEPRPPRGINPAIDADLETICLKCLEKEPGHRYPSALALQEDLDHWLLGEPITARPVHKLERALKWIRRHPVTASLSATLAISLLAGSVAVMWQWHRAQAGWADSARANTRLWMQRAEEQFERGESAAALATVARALRDSPANRAVEERLVNALHMRQFWIPSTHSSPVPPFDLTRDAQSAMRLARSGALLADATSATNIIVTGPPFAEAPLVLTPPKSGVIRHIALSPDTHRLAAAMSDFGVCVWDIRTRQLIVTFPHAAGASSVDFDPTGHLIATGGTDGIVRLWRLNKSEPLSSITAHLGPVLVTRFNKDGSEMLTGGEDGVVCTWNSATMHRSTEARNIGAAIDELKLEDAQHLVLRLRDNRVLHFARQKPNPKASTSHESNPVFVDHSSPNLKPIESILGMPATNFHSDAITHFEVSPDGGRIATASTDGTARIWDSRTHQPLTPPMPHKAAVNHARFSPDGLRIGTSSSDQLMRVWDVATGMALTDWLESEAPTVSARFSQDGRELLASNGQHWPLHHGEQAASGWLSELAEALAGSRITALGVSEPIRNEQCAEIFNRLANTSQPTDKRDAGLRLFQTR